MTLRDVGVTPGTGDAARFDDKTQVVKIEYGAEGAHNLLTEKPATEAKQDALISAISSASTEAEQEEHEHILQAILLTLQHIKSNLAPPDSSYRTRVSVESLVTNAAVNVAQVGNQNTATGQGASGNGAARVTPASDTAAGIIHPNAMLAAACNIQYHQQFTSLVTF